MGEISLILVIVLALYAGFAQIDAISLQLGFYSPLFAATLTGLLLGDVSTGLIIGATMQLLTLGVATYGGASTPDYLSGSIIATALVILTGAEAETGIAFAAVFGTLLTQLDVFGRTLNVGFQHAALRQAEKGNDRGVAICNVLGILPWTLTRIIPVFLGLYFGTAISEVINTYIPQWLMAGLRTAGQLLPAMGIALLLRYLPIKKFFGFLIIGFVVMAYVAGISVLGVSLLGLALAAIYMLLSKENNGTAAGANSGEMEVEIDE